MTTPAPSTTVSLPFVIEGHVSVPVGTTVAGSILTLPGGETITIDAYLCTIDARGGMTLMDQSTQAALGVDVDNITCQVEGPEVPENDE